MTILKNFHQFGGRHWETGSVHNYFAYRGFRAPHTGKPYSEALLLGVSGGVTMGYFSFAYEGYDPMARILTRNTFDPFDRMLERLGVVQHVIQTANPEKARRNLLELLDAGIPPIAWADYFRMPYNALPQDAGMWAMFPLVVYGYDSASGEAWIADRARVPLKVTTEALDAARAQVKKDKFRLLELEPPNPGKLISAVQNGIWDCIRLFIEAPPKGGKDSFGFAAYQRWADLLVKPKMRLSWAREFPPGAKMVAGMLSAFHDIRIFGKDGRPENAADRGIYADFLDEASLILEKPALRQVAGLFRCSAQAWTALSEALLPDSIELLGEIRRLELRRHALFLAQGGAALSEFQAIGKRLEEIRIQAIADFPLDENSVVNLRDNIRQRVLIIHDLERQAVEALLGAMA
jgi:hypothetical protein